MAKGEIATMGLTSHVILGKLCNHFVFSFTISNMEGRRHYEN